MYLVYNMEMILLGILYDIYLFFASTAVRNSDY